MIISYSYSCLIMEYHLNGESTIDSSYDWGWLEPHASKC